MNSNNNVGHGNLSNKFFTLKLLVFQWLILAVICLLPFAITSKLYGQPAVVTIQEIVYLPNGQPARGSLSMRLNAFCVAPPSSSFIYGGVVNTVQLSSTGMLTVQLVPNSSCNPATSYFVTYNLTDSRGNAQPHASETWYIPDSPSTNTIRAVRTGTLPTAPLTMSISAVIGMTIGDVLYGNSFGGVSRLGGNATVNRKFLSSVGNGTTPTAPSWQPIITGTPQAGCLQTPDGYSVTSTGTPCGAGGGGGGDSAVNSAGVINSAYGSLSGSYPTLGGYSGSGTDNGSLTWGDNSGRRFVFGANIASTFTPRFSFYDTGSMTFEQGIVFSSLNLTGSTANGTVLYCTDCTQTTTCSSGGDGAFAFRIDDAWQCSLATTSVSTYSASISSGTTWSVAGSTHNLGTCNLSISAFIVSGSTQTRVEPGSVACDTSSKDVTLTFSVATAGTIVLIREGGMGGGSGGSEGTTVSNAGSGATILKTGSNVQARSVLGTAGIAVTEQTDTITVSGAGYNSAFTAQTSVTITHNLNTLNIVVVCFNGSEGVVEPNAITATDANTATVTFLTAQTGRCIVK